MGVGPCGGEWGGGHTLGRRERCRGAVRLGLAKAYLVWEEMRGVITIAVLVMFFFWGGGGVLWRLRG